MGSLAFFNVPESCAAAARERGILSKWTTANLLGVR
jgi:hypothetical protein